MRSSREPTFLSESSTNVPYRGSRNVEDAMTLSKDKIAQFRELAQQERDARRDADDLADQIAGQVIASISPDLCEYGIDYKVRRRGARIKINLDL